MATITDYRVEGSPHRGEEFFDKYKEGFGNVVEAIMGGEGTHYIFTLKNDKGEEMIIENSCASGYAGTGGNATLRILKQCGFDVDKKFIIENRCFRLKK